VKFRKGDVVIELTDPNTFILAERQGFEPVCEELQSEPIPEPEPIQEPDQEPDDLEELRERAKEMGIRNAHSMKRETLLKKIAEN
jgi:hypothetical protein